MSFEVGAKKKHQELWDPVSSPPEEKTKTSSRPLALIIPSMVATLAVGIPIIVTLRL